MNAVMFIFYTTNVLLFIWGVLFYFSKPHRPTAGYRIVQIASMIIWLWQGRLIYSNELRISLVTVGLVCCLYSTVMFITAVSSARKARLSLAYSDDCPFILIRSGPYRFVRHPFYSSYIVLYAGISFIYLDLVSILLTVLMIGIYWFGARKEELKFKSSELHAEYKDYKEHVTGRFIPFIF